MTSRRSFTKSLAATMTGVVFCTCGMQHNALAQDLPNATKSHHKLPIMMNGKRVRTIDVHSHCFFAAAYIAFNGTLKGHIPNAKGAADMFIPEEDKAAVARRLSQMDEMGVDMEVLSILPFWYGTDRDLSQKIVKINNDGLAELTRAHPDRFAAFCSLSLQYPDLAVQELDYAVRQQGMKGASVGAHVQGLELADPKFYPVWAKAQELGATLFIHPQSTDELNKRFKGNGWLSNTIGNPLDTTIALEHIIFQGVLDKFPTLKILAAHGGGYLPSYAERMDYACYVSPAGCDASIQLKKHPTEYLRQMYYDAIVFSPEGLRHLIAEVGVSQVMLGSDHPIPWEKHPVDRLYQATFLTDAQRHEIMYDNASRVLGIKLT
jgi:predicted TIM-barrel fold metal-dependent hydrolase